MTGIAPFQGYTRSLFVNPGATRFALAPGYYIFAPLALWYISRVGALIFRTVAALVRLFVQSRSMFFHLLVFITKRLLTVRRVTILLSSRSHSTELATAAQISQSPKLRLAVENACCKNGT